MAFLPLLVGTPNKWGPHIKHLFPVRMPGDDPAPLRTFFAFQPLQVAGHVATGRPKFFFCPPPSDATILVLLLISRYIAKVCREYITRDYLSAHRSKWHYLNFPGIEIFYNLL